MTDIHEPPVGTVIVDAHGDAWQHLPEGWAEVRGAVDTVTGDPITTTWALIVEHCGPVRVVWSGDRG